MFITKATVKLDCGKIRAGNTDYLPKIIDAGSPNADALTPLLNKAENLDTALRRYEAVLENISFHIEWQEQPGGQNGDPQKSQFLGTAVVNATQFNQLLK